MCDYHEDANNTDCIAIVVTDVLVRYEDRNNTCKPRWLPASELA